MNDWREHHNKMHNGDKDAILEGLISKSALTRINAIAETKMHGLKETPFVNQLKRLKEDDIVIMGYSVSAFAIAALHHLKIEKYEGNNETVLKAIQSNLDFYS